MVTTRPERRLAAIMAADVVGYSRLMETGETATLAAINTLRAEVIDPLLSEHKGRIVKLMGDGVLVEFHSVVDAVACAVAIQSGVARHQAQAPPARRLVFRIGINLGDVVVEGDDLLGDGVNVAARLEQLCPPGGVLISGTAYDHMKGKLGLAIDFAGEQQVKNISEPIRAYSVRVEGVKQGWHLRTRRFRRLLPMAAALLVFLALAGAGAWWLQPVETAAAKPSIAVLPFDNLGRDEATGRLADGLTEDIITDLSRYREMDVIARNSTAVYKDRSVDVRQVGRDLNVRYVLEGSVQRQGDQIRITAQLIDAGTGGHLWSERWDRPAEDLFAVQTEIAEQVGNRLASSRGAIPEAERAASRRDRPGNLTAYEFYLQGREALLGLTPEGSKEAIRLLTQAVEEDPTLARAWVDLANAYDQSIVFGADRDIALSAGLEAARRAVEVDPMDAWAHVSLAQMVGGMGDLARAEAEFDTALRLNPGNADIMAVYASWTIAFGKPELGAELADRVIRLNPNYPVWVGNRFRYAYFMAGRYEDALRILERQPVENYTMFGWVLRPATYAALGRTDEARVWVNDALAHYPDLTVEGFVIDQSLSGAERQRLVGTMKAAGFPICAKPDQLKEVERTVRLPECSVEAAP
jgi:TolB-like protein/class 3 adenylate cyclase/Flp pilus assembly protein TadD